MFTVYILKGRKGHLYVGSTGLAVLQRVLRHKSGSGAEFTKRNNIYSVAHTEEYKTLKEARQRERQIKGWR